MIHTSLNEYEMQLVTDTQALMIKNIIIQKVYNLFGNLAEEYKNELNDKISDSKNLISPKISRGENYLGLPYVMLDFPRQFGKTDVFAIRSFFWWGNFFSITLQLQGKYRQQFSLVIENAVKKKRFAEWYIGTAENKWDHHFNSDNYSSLAEGINYSISEFSFLKLAKKIPLTQWDKAGYFFTESFKLIIETLISTRQSGETNLLSGTPITGFDL